MSSTKISTIFGGASFAFSKRADSIRLIIGVRYFIIKIGEGVSLTFKVKFNFLNYFLRLIATNKNAAKPANKA